LSRRRKQANTVAGDSLEAGIVKRGGMIIMLDKCGRRNIFCFLNSVEMRKLER
jgi:hypothetical protein